MSDANQDDGAQDQDRFAKRDAETQMVLGSFVTVIAIPVLIGTYWADTERAMIVNLAAGFVLFGIGLAIAVRGLMKRLSQ